MTTADLIVPNFATTKGGMAAASLQELAFLALPVSDGVKILTGWRLPKPLQDWAKTDFSGSDGIVPDEAAFRSHVETIAQHKRELIALPRPEMRAGSATPWGVAQQSLQFAEGVVSHSTASHGGFHLSIERNSLVHEQFRIPSGWYEEDCDWAIVAYTFPDLFTGWEAIHAEKTLKAWLPTAWEAVTGQILAPGESRKKDEESFYSAHQADWLVISAVTSTQYPGMVECHAQRGGRRGGGLTQLYLVPGAEYSNRGFAFIIDPIRHELGRNVEV